MRLPLLISVPHAGTHIPPEVAAQCILTEQQIIRDGDEGAGEIFALQDEVQALVTTDVARAIVDVNRAENDRRDDGVVKTHTIYQVPIYSQPLTEQQIELLLERYYHPYHRRLSQLAGRVKLGIDCHTMAAVGPPIGPGTGQERPPMCLSNADGTCPQEWLKLMADCLGQTFGAEVSLNEPFEGGYIIRAHGGGLHWMQLELSRAPYLPTSEKRRRLLQALQLWCRQAP